MCAARKTFLRNARRSTQIRDMNSELRRVVMPPCGVKRRHEKSTVKRVALRADTARERVLAHTASMNTCRQDEEIVAGMKSLLLGSAAGRR